MPRPSRNTPKRKPERQEQVSRVPVPVSSEEKTGNAAAGPRNQYWEWLYRNSNPVALIITAGALLSATSIYVANVKSDLDRVKVNVERLELKLDHQLEGLADKDKVIERLDLRIRDLDCRMKGGELDLGALTCSGRDEKPAKKKN
jgi:hypothetical protein